MALKCLIFCTNSCTFYKFSQTKHVSIKVLSSVHEVGVRLLSTMVLNAAFEKMNKLKQGNIPAGITFRTVRCYTQVFLTTYLLNGIVIAASK